MLEALEATGQLEDTLVIFMSDHGELFGDHGMYYKGPFFYDPSIRVPLIISCPAIIPSAVSEAMVELVDLAPTLLDAAGLEPSPAMQGKSLWPLLTGQVLPQHHRESVYCEYYHALPWNNPPAYGTTVRTKETKLAVYHGEDSGELYDLIQDSNEICNLWDDLAYKDLKLKMYKKIMDRTAWTIDPLPEREAAW